MDNIKETNVTAAELPQGEKIIEDGLFARFGGYLTCSDVTRALGVSRDKAHQWLEDVPKTLINERYKWSAREIARKLWRDTQDA